MYRVAVLNSHPIQYFAPLYRYLAASPEIDLTVFFLSDLSVREYHDPGFGRAFKWDVPLLGGYRHEFLPCIGTCDRLSFWRPFTRSVRRRLAEGRFDALWVHGYAHQAALRAIAVARSLGIAVMLRGESHQSSGAHGGIRRAIKRRAIPRLLACIDAFLAIGSWNRDYYVSCGVEPERIFPVPYSVDNEFFRIRVSAAHLERESLRAKFGFALGKPVILFAAKLQRRKRAGDLLDAFARLCATAPATLRPYLLFVGDGEQRASLAQRVQSLGLADRVKFTGFRNQTEMPRFYDLCDVFVLPSEAEPWGLVLNEVMNAGKPIIASDQVAAAADLVGDGDNGFIFPTGDVAALQRRLAQILASPEHAAKMGACSLERVARFSFEADRAGLTAALEFVTARARVDH